MKFPTGAEIWDYPNILNSRSYNLHYVKLCLFLTRENDNVNI